MRSRVNTVELYARYQEEQRTLTGARGEAWEKARGRKDRQIEAAKRSNKLRRSTIKLMGGTRFAKKLLKEGFGDDVDSFISFSLSVQNRRKSRAGHALENHLEEIFISRQICYQRGATTENRARPDFLFPSGGEYHDPFFDSNLLTMLGAKSTCKDRWRQVLSEAERIPDKHLLTLETAISTAQTDEMRGHRLQLVVYLNHLLRPTP
ncbi:type II restriction endonuclease [Thiolapillus sp.]|uniref:type II restriction endonuclease n=1 Tax=Thiolapillus sp. TaxID=2017437 RepID=UPI003AF6286A